MDAAASPTVGSYSPQTLITCQLSVDLLQVTQDFLPQHVDQPGDHLGVPPLDAVQRSLWQLGKLRVPDGVDCCGSVQVCQRLHLPAPPQKVSVSSSVFNVRRPRVGQLTTPIRSPRPYSPTSSFFPSSFVMTDRSRPLSTMKVLSELSPCLEKSQRGKDCLVPPEFTSANFCQFAPKF